MDRKLLISLLSPLVEDDSLPEGMLLIPVLQS